MNQPIDSRELQALLDLQDTQKETAEASAEKFSGHAGAALLQEMETDWARAEAAFRELRDFMANDLKIYADKVIRSYTSFIRSSIICIITLNLTR